MGEYRYTMTTSIVGTDDGRETYEIRRTFDVEGKSAVLIALYPTVSLLNPIKMDSSTMYLLNHMHELGYNDIRIVNLFSKVCFLDITEQRIDWMNIIYADYNIYHNSIDICTYAGYILRIDCAKAEEGLKITPNSECALNALAIDNPVEYARLYLDGTMQMWIDAEDSLELW